MAKLIYAIGFLLVFTQAEAQVTAQSCKNFRLGKFEMDSDIGRIKIERNRRHQYETFMIGGKKYRSKFSITWDDSCSYTLIFMKSTLPDYNDLEAQPLRVKIISAGENYYTYTCKMDGQDLIQEGRIEKVKK